MPEPMWDQNRAATDTRVNRAAAAFKVAKGNVGIKQALRFAGYVASHRMNNNFGYRSPSGIEWRGNYIREPMTEPSAEGRHWRFRPATEEERAERYWHGASRTGHRYAKGIHGDNYEKAGLRLVSAAIRKHGPLTDSAEALLKQFENGDLTAHHALMDELEEYHPEAHKLLSSPHYQTNPERMSRRPSSIITLRRYAAGDVHKVKAQDIVNKSPGGVPWLNTSGKTFKPHKTNTTLFDSLTGSRLAIVLHEIRDKFGDHDPQLAAMADKALKGTGDIGRGNDVYTKIRDRLLEHEAGRLAPRSLKSTGTGKADPAWAKRAGDLARGYNWHRVGAGLIVDSLVKEYINGIAKDHLKDRNEQLRAAHNLFGIGSEERNRDPYKHEAFMKGLRAHVHTKAKGAESTYGLSAVDYNDDMLKRSMRRLAQAEEHIYGKGVQKPPGAPLEAAGGLKQAGPKAKVSAVDPAKSAWTGTPNKVRVRPGVPSGQYKRAAYTTNILKFNRG